MKLFPTAIPDGSRLSIQTVSPDIVSTGIPVRSYTPVGIPVSISCQPNCQENINKIHLQFLPHTPTLPVAPSHQDWCHNHPFDPEIH